MGTSRRPSSSMGKNIPQSSPPRLSSVDDLIRPHSALSSLGNGQTSVSARRQKLLQKHRPHSSLGCEALDSPSIIINKINDSDAKAPDELHEQNTRGVAGGQTITPKRLRPSLRSTDAPLQPDEISKSAKSTSILPTKYQEIDASTVHLKRSPRCTPTSKVFWSTRKLKKDPSNMKNSKLSVDGQIPTVISSDHNIPAAKAQIRSRFASIQASCFLRVQPAVAFTSRLRRASTPSPSSSRESVTAGRQGSSEKSRRRFRSTNEQNFSNVAQQLGNHQRHKGKAFRRFRRVSGTIRVIAGICLALKSYVKDGPTKQWSWVEMHLNLRSDMEKNLAFDPITFSKLRVTRGSEKLKSILSLKPHQRTKEDVEVVLALLRNNKAFEQNDSIAKHQLARVMEYQKFEPRRIILKEGHVASCYYIILSGTCLINKKEVDPRNGETFIRTIDEISSGEAFGDNGLLHGCKRTVTVICKDEVEVLLINQENFNRSIRDPLRRRREELVLFCRENHLELNLDDEKIKDNPTAIYTQYFKAGAVICKDMYESEFLYVIKTGRCHVVAEISGCERSDQSKHSIHTDDWKAEAALRRSIHALNNNDAARRGWSDHAIDELHRNGKEVSGTFLVNGLQVTTPQLEAEAAAEKEKVLAIPKTIFGEREDPFPTTHPSETDRELLDSKDGVIRTWKRLTVATTMVGDRERRRNMESMLIGNSEKLFVQIAQLNKGSLFGLESILNTNNVDERIRLILRSDGSEVIFVSKKFFSSDSNLSKALDAASKTTIEYPTARKTLQIVQQQRAWKTHKNEILEQIYRRKRDKSFATS